MTNIGPGVGYAFFYVGAYLGLALPLVIGSFLLDRWLRQFSKSLVIVLAGITALWAVVIPGRGLVNGPETHAILGFFYVVWPLAIGTGVLSLGFDLHWDRAIQLALIGWVVALTGAFVLVAAGWSPMELIAETPALLGIAWLSGYIAYMSGLGVAAGLIGLLVDRSATGSKWFRPIH